MTCYLCGKQITDGKFHKRITSSNMVVVPVCNDERSCFKNENTTSAVNTDGDVLEMSNTLVTKQLNNIIQNNKIASIFDEAKEKFNNKKFDREKLMAQMMSIAMQIAVCDELTGGGNDEKYN